MSLPNWDNGKVKYQPNSLQHRLLHINKLGKLSNIKQPFLAIKKDINMNFMGTGEVITAMRGDGLKTFRVNNNQQKNKPGSK